MNKIAPLGETIRDRRLALGYSLGQLATKVSKTASSIRAWERGEAFPSEEESAALANALDLDPSLLVRLLPDSEVWEADPALPVDVHDPWSDGDDDEKPAADEDALSDEEPPEPQDALDSGDIETETDEPEEDTDAAGDAAVDDEVLEEEPEAEEAAVVEEPELDEAADESVEEHEAAVAPMVAAASVAAAGAAAASESPAESAMHEAMTEAVPVVSKAPVAVFDTPRGREQAAAPSQPSRVSSNPVVAAWDELVGLYRRVFDPRRRWIYRVRWVLLVIALLIMLRVLAWATSNLLDAISEVLDSFSFSPAETPDVEN